MQETQKPVSNVVSAIREEAMTNEVFGAICYDFSMRERTRETLTLRALKARMEKQGADFKVEDYEKVLKFLSDLGLGTLVRNNKGQISALAHLKVTLQSIGKASGLKTSDLEKFRPQRKFRDLPQDSRVILRKAKPYTAHLTIKQGDNPIVFPSLIEIPAEELGEFLLEFSQMTKKLTQ